MDVVIMGWKVIGDENIYLVLDCYFLGYLLIINIYIFIYVYKGINIYF